MAAHSPLGLKTRIRNTAPTRNANANAVGRWQQQARQGDSDYRDNDIRTNKTWAAENPEYWKRYREENPAFVERNRNLQQQRNQKQRTTVIANEDVSHALITPPSGRYRMVQILEDGAIGGQTWIVEITTLTMARVDEDV